MKFSSKKIAAAALVTTALGSAIAVIPSYAQDIGVTATPAAAAPTATAPAAPALQLRGGPLAGLGPDLLTTFDTDGNGVVTQAEIDAQRAGELAEYDADHDGALSLQEYQTYWVAQMFERIVDAFQRLDANGDGSVTAAEFNAGFANLVARLDQDADGALGPTDRPAHEIGDRGGPDHGGADRGAPARAGAGAGAFGPGGPGGFGPGGPVGRR